MGTANFSDDFKRNAVLQITERGYPVAEVSKRLGVSLTQVRARGHSFVIDEPPMRHGTDVGPTPLETMLGALMSCTHVIARRIAHERGIDLSFKKMTCIGHLDHRGIDKEADVPVPFPTIEIAITARTDMGESDLDSFRRGLEQRCPMSVILRQAGTEIVQNWTFVKK